MTCEVFFTETGFLRFVSVLVAVCIAVGFVSGVLWERR